jgi:hypothetical protein
MIADQTQSGKPYLRWVVASDHHVEKLGKPLGVERACAARFRHFRGARVEARKFADLAVACSLHDRVEDILFERS